MKTDPLIKQAFDEAVSYRKRQQEQRLKALCAKYPLLGEYKKEYFAALTRCARGEIRYEELSDISRAINQKRSVFLKSIGCSEEVLEYVPRCGICSDTGFVNGEMCACLKQAHVKALYESSGISAALKKENFRTFDPMLFSPEQADKKLSPRDNILKIRDFCSGYCDSFGAKSESLVFFGSTGTGKSFMAHCVADSLIEAGHTVVYSSALALSEKLIDLSFGRIPRSERNLLFSCDMLIIDEFGAESTELARDMLYNIINERQGAMKATILTTNLNLSMVKSLYHERIFSRLTLFRWLHFYADDLRIVLRGRKK